MKIRITRTREDVVLPTYATNRSVAFDLAAAERTTVPSKGIALIPTGLIIATPEGYALILTARSSLMRKTGLCLANGVGIIDQDFCGPNDEIKLIIWNPTKKDVIVEKNDRLVQGLFVKIDKAEWDEGSTISPSRGGFGSSGGYKA